MSLINKCVAFYRFEEDTPGPAVDATGRGNDFTWNTTDQGSIPVAPDPVRTTGVIGYGVDLNSSFLYRAQSDDFNFQGTSFTIGGWVNLADVLPSAFDPIFAHQGDDAGVALWNLYLSASGGSHLVWTVQDTNTNFITVNSGAVTLGAWHYVRAWLDIDAQVIGIQVDCETAVTTAFTGSIAHRVITAANLPLTFGREAFSYPYASHSLDAWGVWRRVLDTGEAEDLCAGVEYPFGICGYLAYGDYEFSNLFHPGDDNLDWLIPYIKAGRRHGGHSLAATLREKRLTVRGAIVKGPMTRDTVVRTDLDIMRAALGGQPQNLYYEPDRYWRNVRVERFQNIYQPTHYCRIADNLEIGFITSDPFQYAVDESTDTWTGPTTGATRAISIGGNAPAQPTFDLTVGGVGAQTIAFTIENQTTGESFTLTGDVIGGQEITVNTLEQTVTIGTTDEIDLFDGQFLQFTGDADNTLEVTIASGSITSIVTTWRNRWY